MKKSLLVLSAVFVLGSVGALSSCGGTTASLTPVSGHEIALITDVGNIDDHSFNQATWEGVEAYSAASGKGCIYYRPTTDSTSVRVTTIDNAVAAGAKVIVMPGYKFNGAIKEVETKYPNVAFLAIDCTPEDDNYASYEYTSNVTSINYLEQQAGFFAGYAAVKDGYRQLGFCGGMAVPAVIRYGQGYVVGADTAAKELKLADKAVGIKYWYSGTFSANTQITTTVGAWYTAGTKAVFSCGGGIYSSVITGAESANAVLGNTSCKVIGVDVDQHLDSNLIITSAMKNLKATTNEYLTSLYANKMAWGTIDNKVTAAKVVTKGVEANAVGLPTATDSWGFNTFTVAEYEAEYAKVVAGTVTVNVSGSTDTNPTVSSALDVTYIS